MKILLGEEHEANVYHKSLMLTKSNVLKYGAITGFGLGLFYFTMYGNYGLGFYFGSSLFLYILLL